MGTGEASWRREGEKRGRREGRREGEKRGGREGRKERRGRETQEGNDIGYNPSRHCVCLPMALPWNPPMKERMLRLGLPGGWYEEHHLLQDIHDTAMIGHT